jgi:two-component system nitrogen regulation sensor histidine kinase NtrY
MTPINKLILAAKNISLGDYDSPIVAPEFKNELDILVSSFNIMVSKLKDQRRELVVSNKQNAWRDIARKIAHEIKNPLTPIQLAAERLKKKYAREQIADYETFLTCIDTIVRQVKCIGGLVTEFSNFARMPAARLENIDIVQIMREAIFLQDGSNKNIHFHLILNSVKKCFCLVDSSQMNQVFINLLQNSVNAITEDCNNGNVYVTLKKTDTVVIIIEDDGSGFSQDALVNALDPYYTTRKTGSGLGLAVVYKIIVEHGGRIELSNSKKFGGASVRIDLPIVNKL